MKTKIKKALICSAQILVLVSIRLVYFGRVRTSISARNTKIDGPVVIAANHVSAFDPFVIGCFVPLKMFFNIFPYSFMTANIFYYSPFKPLAWLAGCFPAKPVNSSVTQQKYGVGYSKKTYKEGYSVMMFPEGKRTIKPISAKPGISWILEGLEAKLLLCHIEWQNHGWFRTVKLTIKVAESNLNTSNPDEIMKAIYGLQKSANLVPSKQPAM